MIMILIAILLALLLIGLGIWWYSMHQMKKVSGLSARDCLEYTLKGQSTAVTTVGTIQNGVFSWQVYGEDGKDLPQTLHTYEIGSLTKTFTAALVRQAVEKGQIDLDASIDAYLPLPKKGHYPTIRQLLTHTSGYKGFYFESPMTGNFFRRRNDFYGITKDMLLSRLGKVSIPKKDYGFSYSNFGYSTLGLIAERVYGKDYDTLVNDCARELGLTNTHISSGGDLGNLWDWASDDAYKAAGALTSDVEDMLKYASILLEESGSMVPLANISVKNPQYDLFGIHMDAVGYGWMIDKENGVIWHNGGTGNYTCYLGVDPENSNAVVVLSNMPPSARIPATIIGVKLLNELKK